MTMYVQHGAISGGMPTYSTTRNQKAKLVADYGELFKELSTPKIQSIGNYILGQDLGEGSFGQVKLAIHRLTGQNVAIKIIPKMHVEQLTGEIRHHRYLHHPNIISLLEVIPTETQIYMVLEYCKGGELFSLLEENGGGFKENLVRKMFSQLCKAVKYCHDRRIVHRDLKLENILLDSYNNVKLGDFGFARDCEVNQLLDSGCGSPGYTAPEVHAEKKYSGQEADIWSLGVILYTLLCGELPFDDDDEDVMKNKILIGKYEMDESLSAEAKDLITSILKLDPMKRLTLKGILRHPWFSIKDEEDDSYDRKEEDGEDQWVTTTEDIEDEGSISSTEENSNKVEENTLNKNNSNHENAVNYLEIQRKKLFTATKQTNKSSLNGGVHNNGKKGAPSAFDRYSSIQKPISSSPKTWGPSKATKASRRSSIDSKAFNEKVFFTSTEEKELLGKMESIGFDTVEIKKSVLEGKCDSSSGLWWLLLSKLREKKKYENNHENVKPTRVDVAIGTCDYEVTIGEEIEEEREMLTVKPPVEALLDFQDSPDREVARILKPLQENQENIPPLKIYQSPLGPRERRKSLIMSAPEAVEPVLTTITITATASPPLSPKKYSSFASPISSRSVSPIPSDLVIPLSSSNRSYRKKPSFFSALKGWWGGSIHPKDGGNGYKKNGLNWPDSRAVVPSDFLRANAKNRSARNDNKTPPNYDNGVRRSPSSTSKGSLRDKKKKRNSLQTRRSAQLSPLMIPPVAPSVVLSKNSPALTNPIPGTPPARSKAIFTITRRKPFVYPGSSWGKKTVKRQSTSGSISTLLDSFNAVPGSSESHNNNYNHSNNNVDFDNHNYQKIKDTSEKSAEKSLDETNRQSAMEKLTLVEKTRIIESSKSKTIILASPPPTPPPHPSPSLLSSLSSSSSSSSTSIDKETERSTTTPLTTQQPSPSSTPPQKPEHSHSSIAENEDDELSRFVIEEIPSALQQTPTSSQLVPFSSPSLSPSRASSNQLPSSDTRLTRGRSPVIPNSIKGKQRQSRSISPEESNQNSIPLDLLSTPPESPKLLSPRPSSPSSAQTLYKKIRTKSSPLPMDTHNYELYVEGKTLNGIEMPPQGIDSEIGLRSDSYPSPPHGIPFNASHRIFQMNNHTDRASRRPGAGLFNNNTGSRFSQGSTLPNRENLNNLGSNNKSSGLIATGRRPSSAKRPQGMIIEEEEEENDDMEE
ncbi:hypothetical protein G9A89_020514 [Geosiphon pyriformis]|nr:hypothetical protein G9A89_020514 [Geosiphon pyriformis]